MNTFETRWPGQPEEFWLRIGRLCSGQASQQECDRLEDYLLSNESARELFLDYLSVHAELQWRHRDDVMMNDDDLADANPEQPTPFRTPMVAGICAGPKTSVTSLVASILLVASAFYGAFAFIAWNMRPHVDPETATGRFDTKADPSPIGRHGVAKVVATQSGELRNVITNHTLGEGTELAEGDTLEVGKKSATLVFQDGATVTLQPATRFRVESTGSGFLDEGSLIANVPRAAVGFCIETSTVKVVDLGTEFGVNASRQGVVDVAVLTGKVEIGNSKVLADSRNALKDKRIVTAGEAVTVRSLAGRLTIDQAAFNETVADICSKERTPNRVVAFQVPNGTAGNQANVRGGVGLDFDVRVPIRVFSLGVFDHLSDGIDPATSPIVQLWSRDTNDTPSDATDDVGGAMLDSMEFTARESGELKNGHRFKLLDKPIELPVGSYSIVAYGLTDANPFLAFNDADDGLDFRNDPHWVGSDNSTGGNKYGWSPLTSHAGGAPGEVGGTFARTRNESSYGDTALSQTFALHDSISTSGSFHVSNVETMDGQFFVGHYSASAAFGAREFIGMEFREGGQGGIRVRARMNLRDGSAIDGAMSSWIDLNVDENYHFDYVYDPTYEANGSHAGPEGRVTLRVHDDGYRVEQTVAAVLEGSHRDSYAVFDAFGMGIATEAVSSDDANKIARAFVDDVRYSGCRATMSRAMNTVESTFATALARIQTCRGSIVPVGSRLGEGEPGAFPARIHNKKVRYVAGSFEYCPQGGK